MTSGRERVLVSPGVLSRQETDLSVLADPPPFDKRFLDGAAFA